MGGACATSQHCLAAHPDRVLPYFFSTLPRDRKVAESWRDVRPDIVLN